MGMGWDGKGTEVMGIGENVNPNIFTGTPLYSVLIVLQDSSE